MWISQLFSRGVYTEIYSDFATLMQCSFMMFFFRNQKPRNPRIQSVNFRKHFNPLRNARLTRQPTLHAGSSSTRIMFLEYNYCKKENSFFTSFKSEPSLRPTTISLMKGLKFFLLYIFIWVWAKFVQVGIFS